MADWGLYTALRGKNNWAQKRADAQFNFQMTEALRAKRAQENAQRMQSEAKFLEYQNAVQNLDVLKEDQSRIQGVEKEARQNIVSGIAKYDGDINKFMNSGGLQVMNAYEQTIMQSDELKNAIENKRNMALWMADRSKGDRYIKDIKIEKEFDDGQGGKTMKNVNTTMDEQLKLFQEGKLNNFKYNGSEKKVTINPNLFKKNVKDATNPYSKDNYVTQSNYYDAVKMGGASEEQAMKAAQDYGRAVEQSGSPENAWRWGAGNPLELEKFDFQKQQHADQMNYRYNQLSYTKKWNAYKAKMGNKKTGSLMAMTDKEYRTLLNAGDNAQSGNMVLAQEMPKLLNNFFQKTPQGQNNIWGSQYKYSGEIMLSHTVNGNTQTFGAPIAAQNLDIAIGDPSNQYVAFKTMKNEKGQNEVYMPVFAVGNNEAFAQAEEMGQPNAWKVGDFEASDGTNGHSMVGWIPVGQYMRNPAIAQMLDKNMGYTTAHQQSRYLGTATDDELDQGMLQQMLQINPNQDPLVTLAELSTDHYGTYSGANSPEGAQYNAIQDYNKNMERQPE